jgi:hypothetical protein
MQLQKEENLPDHQPEQTIINISTTGITIHTHTPDITIHTGITGANQGVCINNQINRGLF